MAQIPDRNFVFFFTLKETVCLKKPAALKDT